VSQIGVTERQELAKFVSEKNRKKTASGDELLSGWLDSS
jgi:hypothetical protein